MWLKRLLKRYAHTAWPDEQSDFEKMREALRPSQIMPRPPDALPRFPTIKKRKSAPGAGRVRPAVSPK
jgi:hypothetical protein